MCLCFQSAILIAWSADMLSRLAAFLGNFLHFTLELTQLLF